MKKFIINILLVLLLCLGFSFIMDANSATVKEPTAQNSITASNEIQSAKAKIAGDVEVEFQPHPSAALDAKGVLTDNWGILSLGLLSFLEIIVRLTPSEKDNSIFNFVSKILNAIIPNLRKGGGVH